MFGHFVIFLLWSMAWLVSCDPNKHFFDSADPNIFESRDRDYTDTGPVAFSTRVRRQLMSGPSNFFIHDTDTEEESGPWGPWESG